MKTIFDVAHDVHEANQAEHAAYIQSKFEEDREVQEAIIGNVLGEEWIPSFEFTPTLYGNAQAVLVFEGVPITFRGDSRAIAASCLQVFKECACGRTRDLGTVASIADLWPVLQGEKTVWHECVKVETPLQYVAFVETDVEDDETMGHISTAAARAIDRCNGWLLENPHITVVREHITQTESDVWATYAITVAYLEE